MPLKKCQSEGKGGWKYGDSGHCYTGPTGRKEALKQMIAESYNGNKEAQKALSFKDRGIIAMEIEDAKKELEEIEKQEAKAAKMSPPMKQDMKNPILDVQPGYSSIDGESLVKEDAQVNLMQDRVSDNQDYVPSDSE